MINTIDRFCRTAPKWKLFLYSYLTIFLLSNLISLVILYIVCSSESIRYEYINLIKVFIPVLTVTSFPITIVWCLMYYNPTKNITKNPIK